MAAGFSAQVDKEMVKLSGQVHRDNLEAWYAIVREMLLTPGFREDDLARLKQQQANAIRVNLRSNNDEEFGKEMLYERVYAAGHPYGVLNMGHAKDVEAITLDDVRGFFAANFVPQRLTVGLAGDYRDAFRDRLLRELGSEHQRAAQRSALVIAKEAPAVAVSFGWPIDIRRGHPDWVALWLVRSYLGEHRNSSALLYNVIREARGMNYGDYAYIEYFPYGMYRMQPEPNFARDNDLFQVWLRPLRSNNDALFATRAALHELDRLVEHGMGQAEFEASRDFLRKFVAILTAAQDRRLGYALDSRWFDIPAFVDYVRTGLDALTLADVNRVIRQYIDTDAAQFVFIAKDADGLASALAAGTPSPMTYNSDKPAGLLAEDEIIQDYPLGLDASRVTVVPADTLFE
jgi:zinc protease